VNPTTKEYYFLEVNPRLQVEHTITESISMTDIVKAQLLLSQGAKLDDCGLPDANCDPAIPPPAHSIQLRITAENVQSGWSLSIGKITSFQFPTGNGIRMDTHLLSSHPTIVSADFDSLLAKLIITASSWSAAVKKAQRALADTHISGVKTNIHILRGIAGHPDFLAGKCDTQWLEAKQPELLQFGLGISAALKTLDNPATLSSSAQVTTANTLFRKGDAWSLTLSPNDAGTKTVPHHLSLTRVLRNDFPSSLAAEILFTIPPTSTTSAQSTPYTITLASTSASAASATSQHRRGDPSDPTHVIVPFPGKLVEVLVDEGDVVKEGDTICVVQQMKMELEVRSPRSGVVMWVTEAEDGEDVAEGMLAVVIVAEQNARL
jgi:pyruvate carboxylase